VLAQDLEGPFEVVVVDNASTDGSGAYVRERYLSVRLIQAGRNLGFAGGNNLGIRGTRGRYVVLGGRLSPLDGIGPEALRVGQPISVTFAPKGEPR